MVQPPSQQSIVNFHISIDISRPMGEGASSQKPHPPNGPFIIRKLNLFNICPLEHFEMQSKAEGVTYTDFTNS
jgi:hypothetical protein